MRIPGFAHGAIGPVAFHAACPLVGTSTADGKPDPS